MTSAALNVLGVPLNPLGMQQVVALAEEAIAQRRRLLVGVVNAAKLVNMRRDARLRAAVLTADIVLADGMPIVWASRLLGRSLPERVAGIDLMMELLRRASAAGWRVYLLGAEQQVLDEVQRRVAAQYPGVVIAGAEHGYFSAAEEQHVAARIAAARADIVLAAMSSPKKEEFLARWSTALGAPVCHGVGGAFDVMAGKTHRAPRGWQALGLEWLYRMLQEPLRLGPRYLETNSIFVGLLLRAMIARLVGREMPLLSAQAGKS